MTLSEKDNNPPRLLDRELSWLAFNERVLAQAEDPATPLLERCKFLAIVAGNLDEFFMIRVAGVKKQIAAGVNKANRAGFTPNELLSRIIEQSRQMLTSQQRLFNEDIIPALATAGIRFLSPADLTQSQRRRVHQYFDDVLYPIVTPMAIDQSHPLPVLVNSALYLAVRMQPGAGKALRGAALGVIQVPSVVERFMVFREGDEVGLLPLERIIEMHLDRLFAGHEILAVHPFRLTRDTDLELDEDAGEDLLEAVEQQLTELRRGAAVSLNVAADIDEQLLEMLTAGLELSTQDLYRQEGLMDMKGLWAVHELEGMDHLRDEPMPPLQVQALADRADLFAAIRRRDIFLHHPYYSFDPVVRLVELAAEDPQVLAIKQTLYRTSGESPVIAALKRAAANGKHVTVLVELKARLDEERNIRWARELEQAGADVIYGMMGLKTHCKALLIVRREQAGLRRYVHMSTGNYNGATARVYTDIGVFSAKRALAEDVSALFNVITGYSAPPRWNLIEIAPTGLRSKFTHLINREIELHSPSTPGFIRAKMNGLSDPALIELLYQASQAGVRIELLVRGICCLRPGVAELSENITVRSVVDRFLEHSRIYHFHAGGKEEVYISSADWMQRNMDRRIEALIPVPDAEVRRDVLAVLDAGLSDNVKAWTLQADGSYMPPIGGDRPYRSQVQLYQQARDKLAPIVKTPPTLDGLQRRQGPR